MVEPALQLFPPLGVGRLVEGLRHVEVVQDRHPGSRIVGHLDDGIDILVGGLHLAVLRLRVGDNLVVDLRRFDVSLDSLEQGSCYGQGAISLVGPLDDMPRSATPARLHDCPLRGADEVIVAFPVLPVLLLDPPAGEGVLLELLETFPLRFLPEVHPELHDEGMIVRERLLEGEDLVEGFVEFADARIAVDVIENRLGVPGTEKEPDSPVRRQVSPVPPEVGALLHLLGRLPVGTGHEPSRIEPSVEEVHRFALAGPIDSSEDDNHRKRFLAELELRFEKLLSERRCLFRIFLLRDFAAQFGGIKHD